MTSPEMFLWGFGGSLAVEIVTLAQGYAANQKVPERYTKVGFYVVRLLLAGVGGGLAVAYGIDKPILAANIGAATPLIIQTLTQGIPSGMTGGNAGGAMANAQNPPAAQGG